MSIASLPDPFAQLLDRVETRHDRKINVGRVPYECDGTPLEGFLAEPEGAPSGRAVLVFHAWMGVGANVEMRAQMLARLGYTAFAADVYGEGVRPETIPEMQAEAERYYNDITLMRRRARAGFDELVERGFAPGDIVVIGYCFGGTVALELGRSGQSCAGIVSFHGSLLVHEPSDANRFAAPLLILSGTNDPIVPDSEITAFMDDLRTAPHLDWKLSLYAGAEHAFTSPGPKYQEAADRRSWEDFTAFLNEFLPVDDVSSSRAHAKRR